MKDLLILAYHRILPENKIKDDLVVTTDDFKKQLNYLKSKGYSFVKLEDLNILRLDKLNKKYCVITFDDGYRDNYLYALPILEENNIKATFFVTVGNVGKNLPFYWDLKNRITFDEKDYAMSWEELKDLNNRGFEIGSHTINHFELPLLGDEEQFSEVKGSKDQLDSRLNQNTSSFCYPRGNFKTQMAEMLDKAGYKIAVVTPNVDNIKETNYTLKRVGIYAKDSLLKFKIKTSFWFNILRKFRRD